MKINLAEKLDKRLRLKDNERELTDQERSITYGESWHMFYGKGGVDPISYSITSQEVRLSSPEASRQQDYDEQAHARATQTLACLEDSAAYTRASRVNRIAGRIEDSARLASLMCVPALVAVGCIMLRDLLPNEPPVPDCVAITNDHTVLVPNDSDYRFDLDAPAQQCVIGIKKFLAVEANGE